MRGASDQDRVKSDWSQVRSSQVESLASEVSSPSCLSPISDMLEARFQGKKGSKFGSMNQWMNLLQPAFLTMSGEHIWHSRSKYTSSLVGENCTLEGLVSQVSKIDTILLISDMNGHDRVQMFLRESRGQGKLAPCVRDPICVLPPTLPFSECPEICPVPASPSLVLPSF